MKRYLGHLDFNDGDDREKLARHIERGGAINAELRKLLADLVRGKSWRGRGRPEGKTTRRLIQIAEFVDDAKRQGMSASSANNAAAEHFKVTVRTVQNANSWMRDYEKFQIEFERQEENDRSRK
jgi:hypothetical protein